MNESKEATYARVVCYAVARGLLSATEARVLSTINAVCVLDEFGTFEATNSEIAKYSGYTSRTVSKALGVLSKRGWGGNPVKTNGRALRRWLSSPTRIPIY